MPEINNSSTINLLNKAYKDSTSGAGLRSLNWGRKDTGGGFSKSRQATGKKSRSYKSQTPDLKNPKTKKRNGRGNSGKGRNLKPASKNAPPPAQNISQFGGGVKANNANTFKGIAAGAASAGRATASLPKAIGSGLIQSARANPALALIVGNIIVWRKNVESIKKIYDYGNTPVYLGFPRTNAVIVPAVSAPFTGGQSAVTYAVSGTRAKNGVNYCEQPDQIATWGFTVFGPIHGIGAEFVRTDDKYNCPDYQRIVGKANFFLAYLSAGSNPSNSANSIIYFYEPHTPEDVIKITSIVRADGLPDTGGDLPLIVEPVVSAGGVSTGDFTPLPREQKPAPLALPETESEILVKPLIVPATSPRVETAPVAIPKLEPLPETDINVQPTSPTEAPPVKEKDTAKRTAKKKPTAFTKESRGFTRESRGFTRESRGFTRESRGRIPGVPAKAKIIVPGISPPSPNKSSTPTTKVLTPPAPAPTTTPVDECKKGCAVGLDFDFPDFDELEPKLEFVPIQVEQITCVDGVAESKMITVDVLKGTEAASIEAYAAMAKIQKAQCEFQPIASVPEWWQLRPEGHRPQLIVHFGEVNPNGKIGKAMYALTIPHYTGSKDATKKHFQFSWSKGSVEGILTLKDNSKIIVNAASKGEAERIIGLASKYVSSSKLIDSFTKIGERKGQPFKQITVKPKVARFFAEGTKSTLPTWVVKLNEDKE